MLTAVMRETLRMYPPASARSVAAIEDTTLSGGKYAVKAGENLVVVSIVAQHDPAVWGEDVSAG
jgi:cytochrome P450/NADPH-cytochrome P450 reductase